MRRGRGHRNLILTMAMDLSAARGPGLEASIDLEILSVTCRTQRSGGEQSRGCSIEEKSPAHFYLETLLSSR